MASREAQVAVLVDDDYQELEFWYPVLRFREEGAAVTVIASAPEREYVGRLGYPVIPDIGVSDTRGRVHDLVVLPGGPAANRMARNPDLVGFITRAWASGSILAACSHAPAVLSAAGLLAGRCVGGAPEIAASVTAVGAHYSSDHVVTDGKMVTARSADSLPMLFTTLTGLLAA